MQIIAAIEYDRLRQEPGTWNKVILHREGKFYRAYEWSAWLIKTVVCTEAFQKERGDTKPLSCHRQKNKSGEFAMLGFPVESISKFIPTHKNIAPLTDSPDDICIEIDIPLQGDETYEQLRHRFESWRGTLPEPANKSNKANSEAPRKTGAFQIIADLIAYPLERKTADENIEFISSLKQKAAELL